MKGKNDKPVEGVDYLAIEDDRLIQSEEIKAMTAEQILEEFRRLFGHDPK